MLNSAPLHVKCSLPKQTNKQKKQDKTPEKEIHETEVSCLLDEEFKVIVIKMLIKLYSQVYKLSENFNKEIKII